MRTIVKGKNYEVPDRVRAYAERKLGRLDRLLDDRSDAIVELSVERHRNDADSHVVDITLVVDGQTVRGRATAPTHQAGVDEVLDKVERQAVGLREKPRDRARTLELEDGAAASTDADDGRGRIVKVKRFAIEPMFAEDAV
ncbi:MAG TPA: ribosome-associated translation inhibitor RaiA, partial [Candidatus Acidoferrales bacterium]|nr:ribosome-associated translation inhibitor RaiA [Candidatus Acidoferrales bacterium]